MGEIGLRASSVYADAWVEIAKAVKQMGAEHSAAGRLQSGATIKRTVAILVEKTRAATTAAIDSAARRIKSRGKQWREACAEIEAALEAHLAIAPEMLDKQFRWVGEDGPRLAEPLLGQAKSDLLQQLHEFRDGWTAPEPKPWHERNAVLYAILLIIAGAIIGKLVELGMAALN